MTWTETVPVTATQHVPMSRPHSRIMRLVLASHARQVHHHDKDMTWTAAVAATATQHVRGLITSTRMFQQPPIAKKEHHVERMMGQCGMLHHHRRFLSVHMAADVESKITDLNTEPTVSVVGKEPPKTRQDVGIERLSAEGKEHLKILKDAGITIKFDRMAKCGPVFSLFECPVCPKPHNNDPTNLWTAALLGEKLSGFNCMRCRKKHNNFESVWQAILDKKKNTRAIHTTPAPSSNPTIESQNTAQGAENVSMPTAAECNQYTSRLLNLEWSDKAPAIQFLNNRGLGHDVVKTYQVGLRDFRINGHNHEWLTFPWSAKPGQFGLPASLPTENGQEYVVYRHKIRRLDAKNFRILPAGNRSGMFGWHTLPDDVEAICITEGEFDAMIVNQATKMPTLSIPNGAGSFTQEHLTELNRLPNLKKIYLWYDSDEAGQKGCEVAARLIGLSKCLIVRPTREYLERKPPNQSSDSSKAHPKDANDLYLQGYNLQELIDMARPLKDEKVVRFHDLKEDVRRECNATTIESSGMQSTAFPSLTTLLGGLRQGELTLVTGSTGSGKTTFLSQLSLDYCRQGARTLWGSFEIKNTRLIASMMKQLKVLRDRKTSSLDLGDPVIFQNESEAFAGLELYFLKYFGSTPVEMVVQSMTHAVQAHGVMHIVLDNLQFMVNGVGHGSSSSNSFSSQTSMWNKFDAQERALDQFRAFATNHNVHVTLVVHPRKEPEGNLLSIDSIMGSAKATQEADNVIIIQRGMESKFVDVRKNRFNGELGRFDIMFDRETKSFIDKGNVKGETMPGGSTGYMNSMNGRGGGWGNR